MKFISSLVLATIIFSSQVVSAEEKSQVRLLKNITLDKMDTILGDDYMNTHGNNDDVFCNIKLFKRDSITRTGKKPTDEDRANHTAPIIEEGTIFEVSSVRTLGVRTDVIGKKGLIDLTLKSTNKEFEIWLGCFTHEKYLLPSVAKSHAPSEKVALGFFDLLLEEVKN